MATIQELSKRCGVSISTISKALNGYSDISDKTRELVIDTANEMGYFPNANTRALRLKKTYNIGLLVNTDSSQGLKNDYYTHVLSAFREEAASKGYNITFIEHKIGKRTMTYLECCQYRHLDGVCILSAEFENEEVAGLVNSEIPLVTIDKTISNKISVLSDNYGGMKQLTNFIIRQGHTKIALIHGADSTVTRKRMEGFMDAFRENKIEITKEYIMESAYHNAAMAEEAAIKLLQKTVRPTCIIAPDDPSAIGVFGAIRKQGLQVVKEISVAGYDTAESSPSGGVKLTTVKQERDSIGREAARNLIQSIESDQVQQKEITIKQTLIIGNSVRKLM